MPHLTPDLIFSHLLRSHPASLQRTAPPLPKSTYQRRLEAEDQGIPYDSDEKLSDSDSDYEDETSPSTSTSNPNSNAIGNQRKRKSSSLIKEKEREKEFHYWSNYNKSFFHPNSILPIGGQLLSSMIGSTAETSYINSDQFQFPEEDGRNRFESWEFGVRTFDEVEKVSVEISNPPPSLAFPFSLSLALCLAPEFFGPG